MNKFLTKICSGLCTRNSENTNFAQCFSNFSNSPKIHKYSNNAQFQVTYKFVSKELEVHVNTAKEILSAYWNRHKSEIDAAFVIKGQLLDGSLRFEVTRAANLENAKAKFTRLDFEHIYSLHKSLPDLELLATADEADFRFSAIKFAHDVMREGEPKRAFEPSTSSEKPKEIHKENVPKVMNTAKKAKESPVKKVEESKKKEDEDEIKDKEVEKEKVAEEKKVSPKSKPSDANAKGKNTKKPVQSTKAGFQNLFGKVSNQPKPPPKKEKSPEPEKKKPEVEEKVVKKSPPPKKIHVEEKVVEKASPSPKKTPVAKSSAKSTKSRYDKL